MKFCKQNFALYKTSAAQHYIILYYISKAVWIVKKKDHDEKASNSPRTACFKRLFHEVNEPVLPHHLFDDFQHFFCSLFLVVVF